MLHQLIASDERTHAEPAPVVVVSELADSSVNFTIRVWCNAADYWGIYYDMQEKVKLAFDKEGLTIPYPQQDLHLFNAKAALA